jgi:hypothetical protein
MRSPVTASAKTGTGVHERFRGQFHATGQRRWHTSGFRSEAARDKLLALYEETIRNLKEQNSQREQ